MAPSSLRSFRAGYWFGGFNGLTWMMSLGTPMVLLTEQLGGSAFQVGLASSFLVLLFPVQVVATALLPRLGFRRQMVLAWTARATFLLIPLGLAWHAPDEPAPWMPGAVVASVFGFCFCRAIGVAAHIPWFAAILPEHLRGRFFATDSAITSVVGVAALLTCALLFARLPTYPAFRVMYLIAVTGSALAVLNLLRLPVGPRPPRSPLDQMAGEVVRLSLRRGIFRQYLVASLTWLLATGPIPAFSAYYLKVATNLPSSQIVSYTAVQFLGQIIGAWSIRQWIDRTSIRRFFQTSAGIAILVSLIWLGIISGGGRWAGFLWVAYVLFGVAVGIYQAAHFTYLPELSPPDRRPVTIAIFGAVAGVISGLAPMLWGLVLRTADATPGIDIPHFAAFFATAIGLCVLGICLLETLPDSRTSVEPARPVG